MTELKFSLVVAAILLAALCGVHMAQAQEPTTTKAWVVGTVIGVDVGVIDTGGVCIYVAQRLRGEPAISAVPKTGVVWHRGCQ